MKMMQRGLGLGARALSVVLTLFVIFIVFSPFPPLQERGIFVLLLLLILFLREATKRPSSVWIITHAAILIAVAVVFGYIVVYHERVEERVGLTTTIDVVLGTLAMLLVLDATRRVAGWVFFAFIMIFLLYGIGGELIPVAFGGHSGFGIDRIVSTVYLSTNGLFGIVLYVMYKYVFMFILLGRVLEESGALNFIMNLSRSLVGHIKGGPAMVSTVSSGLVGSITGSAVANVVITGSVTIPMMKNMGFSPHMAGAVEAAASTGGQFMPPVMGSVAFLIMQFLGVSYFEVMKAAVIPAVIYYVAIGVAVYFYADRCGIKGLPRNELPKLMEVLLNLNALTFIAGLGSLLVFLILRYSPSYAALWSIAVMIGISFLTKDRIVLKKTVRILEQTPIIFLEVGVAGVGVGIMVGIIMLTGLATRLSSLILALAGDNLMLTLVLTMATSIILGTGLPTAVSYTLLAILVAPTLVKIGVVPLAAHMFIFYSGMMTVVTPPVAMAAYAAASLAGASMWRTGVAACMLSLPAYILPYIFVLDNSLMLMGSDPLRIFWAIFRSLIGCSLLAFALIGPVRNRKEGVRRLVFGTAAVFLIIPQWWADTIAVLLFLPAVLPAIKRRWESHHGVLPK